jgi:hypothetical protein
VGDVNHRRAKLSVQSRNLPPHLHTELGIEIRERFIEQENLRLAHDCPSDSDALPLAAGHLSRRSIKQLLDSEYCSSLTDACIYLALAKSTELEREGEVLVRCHVRVQRIVLENHGDVTIFRREVIHHASTDEQLAGRNRLESSDHPQGGALPASGRANEYYELAVRDLEIHVVNGYARTAIVYFSDSVQPYARHDDRPPKSMRRRTLWRDLR